MNQLLLSRSKDGLIAADQAFFHIRPVDENRVCIELIDYRHIAAIKVGLVMNLGDEDWCPHSLEWALDTLSVQMVNYVMNMAQSN